MIFLCSFDNTITIGKGKKEEPITERMFQRWSCTFPASFLALILLFALHG
jgi:hypothetical protein